VKENQSRYSLNAVTLRNVRVLSDIQLDDRRTLGVLPQLLAQARRS
jgi:hypothetical protein